MKASLLLVVALLCACVYTQNIVSVFTIDDFNFPSPALVIVLDGSPKQPVSNFVSDASILGGERDMELIYVSGNSNVLSCSVADGEFSAAAPKGGTGQALLQYDGEDDSLNLDPSGLSGTDFTFGSAYAFRVNITADLPTNVEFRVYSGSTSNYCSYVTIIPGNSATTFFTLQYSAFTNVGTGCSFSNVGALEIEADLQDSVDVVISVLEAIALGSPSPSPSRSNSPSPSRAGASASNTPSNTRTPTPTRSPSAVPRSPSNTPSPSSCLCTCPELECFMFKFGEYQFYGNRNLKRDAEVEIEEDGFDFLKFF